MLIRALAAALILAFSVGATASTAPLTPLIWGWERFFTLEWQADTRNGAPYVSGYIKNDAGTPAANIRLLVEALGPGDQVASQRVEWLGTMLTPGTRAHFQVPAPAAGPAYRVSVFAFDWVQAGGDDLP
jgi:hypothetical protein